MKAVLRGKFIALTDFTNKIGISHTSELTTYLKAFEQTNEQNRKKLNTPKRSKCQKIVKLRTEVNKLEKKKRNNSKNEQNQELIL